MKKLFIVIGLIVLYFIYFIWYPRFKTISEDYNTVCGSLCKDKNYSISLQSRCESEIYFLSFGKLFNQSPYCFFITIHDTPKEDIGDFQIRIYNSNRNELCYFSLEDFDVLNRDNGVLVLSGKYWFELEYLDNYQLEVDLSIKTDGKDNIYEINSILEKDYSVTHESQFDAIMGI